MKIDSPKILNKSILRRACKYSPDELISGILEIDPSGELSAKVQKLSRLGLEINLIEKPFVIGEAKPLDFLSIASLDFVISIEFQPEAKPTQTDSKKKG